MTASSSVNGPSAACRGPGPRTSFVWLNPCYVSRPSRTLCGHGRKPIAAGGNLIVQSVHAAQRIYPDRLVVSGSYARTRNPMYLGWALLHLGLGTVSGSTWVVVTFPPAAAWLHREVLSEERTLAKRFADQFEHYRPAVPRYNRAGRAPSSTGPFAATDDPTPVRPSAT
jgi:hypothetical protein